MRATLSEKERVAEGGWRVGEALGEIESAKVIDRCRGSAEGAEDPYWKAHCFERMDEGRNVALRLKTCDFSC